MHTKRLVGILVGVLLSFGLNAGQTETGGNGEYSVAPEGVAVVTQSGAGFSVARVLMPYQSAWQKAYENGKNAEPVPIKVREEPDITGMFELTTTHYLTLGAQYNAKRNMVVPIKDGRQVGKPEHQYVFPALVVCLWVTCVVCMVVSVVYTYTGMKLENDGLTRGRLVTTLTVLSCLTILTGILAARLTASASGHNYILAATLAAQAAWIAADDYSSENGVRISAVVYFVCMFFGAYLLYTM